MSGVMKTKRSPAQDDQTFILTPNLWPSWPYCPVKRKDRRLENNNLGVLMATQEHQDAIEGNGQFTVFHIYMFSPPRDKAGWNAAPRINYKNIQDLMADGWEVD